MNSGTPFKGRGRGRGRGALLEGSSDKAVGIPSFNGISGKSNLHSSSNTSDGSLHSDEKHSNSKMPDISMAHNGDNDSAKDNAPEQYTTLPKFGEGDNYYGFDYDSDDFYNPYDDDSYDIEPCNTAVSGIVHDTKYQGGFGALSTKSATANDNNNCVDEKYTKAVRDLNVRSAKQKDGNMQLRKWLDELRSKLVKKCPDDYFNEAWEAFLKIEKCWKNSSDVDDIWNVMNEVYSSVTNPFAATLMVFERCRQFQKGNTKSLPYVAVDRLKYWLDQQPITKRHELNKLVTKDVKRVAFVFANKGVPAFMRLVCKVYQLDVPPDNEEFYEHLEPLLKIKKYKEVVQCAAACQLQHKFNTDEVIFPLIAQDKLSVVEEYMQGSEKVQREVLTMLDGFLPRGAPRPEQVAVEREIADIKLEKLAKNTLRKLAKRWMRQFDIDVAHQELCPTASLTSAAGGIKHLVYRRYFQGEVSLQTFRELLRAEIFNSDSQTRQLQETLVRALLNFQVEGEARRWVDEFGWTEEEMPEELKDVEPAGDMEDEYVLKKKAGGGGGDSGGVGFAAAKGFGRWDRPCLKLPFDVDEVVMVDTRECYLLSLEKIIVSDKIGLDVEWRPALGGAGVCDNPVALLQIGTRDSAWLFDIPALKLVLSDSDWMMSATDVFGSRTPMKLGYSLEEDLRQLWRTVPQLEPAPEAGRPELCSCLDMAGPSKCLMVAQPHMFKLSEHDALGVSGLSELALRTLGYKMDKTEQMSDWETRPLREEQVHYAALDAVVLVMVHDELELVSGQLPGCPSLQTLGLLPKEELQPAPRSKGEKYRVKLRQEKNPEVRENQEVAVQEEYWDKPCKYPQVLDDDYWF